jgi:hypothetical protein
LGAKDGQSFASSFTGEWAVSQTIHNHRPQTSRRLDNFPCVATDFLTLNGDADTATFKST